MFTVPFQDVVQEDTDSQSLTWMHMLNVPNQDGVQEAVQDHHHGHHEEIELVMFCGGHVDVLPLNPNAHLFIEGKIFGSKSKRSC